jgi:hypothetical protein
LYRYKVLDFAMLGLPPRRVDGASQKKGFAIDVYVAAAAGVGPGFASSRRAAHNRAKVSPLLPVNGPTTARRVSANPK